MSWNKENPLTAEGAKLKITELKDKLSKEASQVREDTFKRAEKFIDKACPCGVQGDSKKTFLVKGTASEIVETTLLDRKSDNSQSFCIFGSTDILRRIHEKMSEWINKQK